MRRLVIIVEGDTEKEFVEKTLRPYLAEHGIYNISCYKIKKTNGGLTNYMSLRTDLLSAVHETNVLVTTLIDYYALPPNFPGYAHSITIADKELRLDFLEQAILNDIHANGYASNLHPYIQLHEFESLLFTNPEGFELNFTEDEADLTAIKELIKQYPNPEEINDTPENAPSKRLQRLIPSYRKIVFGNIVVESNGIDAIINCCPRFRNWLQEITHKVQN